MEKSELEKKLKVCADIVVWGHSAVGDFIYDMLAQACPNSRIHLCDNNKNLQVPFNDEMILSSKQAVAKYPDAAFVVTSEVYCNIMRLELLEAGIPEEHIFYGVTEEAKQKREETARKDKYIPLKKLQFEIDIAEHCNLDCNCCSQFAAIAQPQFVNLESMRADFKRLGELFSGEVERLYLIGGEPLLNPDIIECMSIARNYFPVGEIAVFTNGLLLRKMPDEFWRSCRENKIGIITTKYPIAMDYIELQSLVEDNGVSFQLFGSSDDFKYMCTLGLDIEGRQDCVHSFENCVEANNCIKLKAGKLYTCTRPVAIHKFNDYFKQDLQVSDKDCIDIYEAKNADEILKFLSKPIPFCRYCTNVQTAQKWGHSTKEIEEWT